MDEILAWITGHRDLTEKLCTKDSRSICKQNKQFFTLENLIDSIVIFVLVLQMKGGEPEWSNPHSNF